MNTLTKTLATFTAAALIGASANASTIYFQGGQFGASTVIVSDTNQHLYDAEGVTWTNSRDNWTISGEALTATAANQRSRLGTNTDISSVTGTGWSFAFDVSAYTIGNLDDVQLWLGLEDGNNVDGDSLVNTGATPTVPENNIVVSNDWNQVVNVASTTPTGTGTISFDISAENMSLYDIAVLTFEGGNGAAFTGSLDNFRFTQVPEPGSLVLLGLGGLLVAGRRRRA